MKRARLTLMVGIPGSGKSSWAAAQNKKVISRDEIRFSMVSKDEKYFSKENKVFDEFCTLIALELSLRNDVIADATHINKKSRAKLINGVKEKYESLSYRFNFDKDIELSVIVIKTSLKTALNQNENRKGTRSYVPKEVIKRMYEQFEEIQKDEPFDEVTKIIRTKKEELK